MCCHVQVIWKRSLINCWAISSSKNAYLLLLFSFQKVTICDIAYFVLNVVSMKSRILGEITSRSIYWLLDLVKFCSPSWRTCQLWWYKLADKCRRRWSSKILSLRLVLEKPLISWVWGSTLNNHTTWEDGARRQRGLGVQGQPQGHS